MENILSNSLTEGTITLIIFIIIIAEIFWFIQFLHLMTRKDSYFLGRYDKLCWVAIFIFLNCIGAFVYMILKPFNRETKTEEIPKFAEEYFEPCLKCGKTIPKNSDTCPYCGWSYSDDK